MSLSEKSAGSPSAPDQGSEADTLRADFGHVLLEIATGCSALRELLHGCRDDNTGFVVAAAEDLVSRIGYIADRAAEAAGQTPAVGNADDWLLSPACQAGLDGLHRVARLRGAAAQGGAL